MSIRITFQRFVIWNVFLVYEKLSLLGLSWNFVLLKEIIFKSLRCFIILLNTYYNKVSNWLNANLSTNNGGSGV